MIPDSVVEHMVENYTEREEGVRNLKRCLEVVHRKLNLYRLIKPDTPLFEKEMSLKVTFPFSVTDEVVDKLVKQANDDKRVNLSLYLYCVCVCVCVCVKVNKDFFILPIINSI